VDQRAKRDLYSGFGNSLSRAFEIALIPLIFAVPGWGLDHWLGTSPVFALVFGGFGLAGVAARSYYEYAARMDAELAKLPGQNRRAAEREFEAVQP
jgi:putative F0F1-ATPase subunit (Ca2+/Mg2+ transporter)